MSGHGTSRPRPMAAIEDGLIANWFEFYQQPVETQERIDSLRMVPVADTIQLFRQARSGRLIL